MTEIPVKKAVAKKAPAKKAAAPAKPKYEHVEYLDKAPSEVHQGFTEWIVATTGHTVPSGDVGLVLRLYPLYLKSPAVVAARDLEKAERDRVKAVKEAERKERLQAKLDEIEGKRAKLLAELGLDDEPFDEPEPLEPEDEPVADLAAAKREKARRIAAAAAEPAQEPEDDEAAWEGDDEFADDAVEAAPEGGAVTLESAEEPEATDDDEAGLWDEDDAPANEEEF